VNKLREKGCEEVKNAKVDTRSKLEKAFRNACDEKQKVQEENERNKQRIDQAYDDLDEADETIERLKGEVEEQKERVTDLNELLDAKEREINRLQNRNTASIAAQRPPTAALAQALATSASLSDQCTTLRNELHREREAWAELDKENRTLRQSIHEETLEKNLIAQDLAEEKEKSAELQAELTRSQTLADGQVKSLQSQLTEAKNQTVSAQANHRISQNYAGELFKIVAERDDKIRAYEAEARAHICIKPVTLSTSAIISISTAPTPIHYHISPTLHIPSQVLSTSSVVSVSIEPVTQQTVQSVVPPKEVDSISELVTRLGNFHISTTSSASTTESALTSSLFDAPQSTTSSISSLSSTTSPPSPSSYDARLDVADIDAWWFDEPQFEENWKAATFIYRRTRPHCDDCRTRKALRLIDDEWKLPEDFHLKIPCDKHAKSWLPLNDDPGCRWSRWNRHCADCIAADSRESGQEDFLPKEVKDSLRCRDPTCKADVHDKIQSEARFVLAEHDRKKNEKWEAQRRHIEKLAEYRGKFGRFWPTFKGDRPPTNFAYGAFSYGRGRGGQ
jgi:hypothetical protein